MLRHKVFQASLLSALLDGVYDGDLTVGELLEHGDFGLGTFNGLDGEMLVLDGICYRLRADGTVGEVDAAELTPFAVITRFAPEVTLSIDHTMTRDEVVAMIESAVGTANYLFAVRVRGRFAMVQTRTVVKQTKPYVGMREAVRDVPALTFADTTGTVAGFRTPLYERGISVPGGHVHYVDDAHTHGGHVIDFTIENGTVEICRGTDLELRLPLTDAFKNAQLSPDDLDEQTRVTESPG
ncbi:acetolactate decarboxylase [Microbacterium marmarense]|uniref:Alpha-acetolactate decarboxylase n=1 Tax=Microbacterium marmarense TaxID=3122051 RepID=A0ABU8LU48_9MICO